MQISTSPPLPALAEQHKVGVLFTVFELLLKQVGSLSDTHLAITVSGCVV